jgi:hypothetical protein
MDCYRAFHGIMTTTNRSRTNIFSLPTEIRQGILIQTWDITGITVYTDYATAMRANELRHIHSSIVEDVDYVKEKWDEQSLTTAVLPHDGSRTGKVKWQMRDGYWEVFMWEGKHNKEVLEVVSFGRRERWVARVHTRREVRYSVETME